jgi:hypothetical protein
LTRSSAAIAGSLESLQNHIFSVLEPAALKTLLDERLDFGLADLNGHGKGSSSNYAPVHVTPNSPAVPIGDQPFAG